MRGHSKIEIHICDTTKEINEFTVCVVVATKFMRFRRDFGIVSQFHNLKQFQTEMSCEAENSIVYCKHIDM